MIALRTIRWIFWNVVYRILHLFYRHRSLTGLVVELDRTRSPWWKWEPDIFYNEAGQLWEIWFENDSSWAQTENVRLTVHRAQSDNRVVGLIVYKELLEPKE